MYSRCVELDNQEKDIIRGSPAGAVQCENDGAGGLTHGKEEDEALCRPYLPNWPDAPLDVL